jgi:hypothetical protein
MVGAAKKPINLQFFQLLDEKVFTDPVTSRRNAPERRVPRRGGKDDRAVSATGGDTVGTGERGGTASGLACPGEQCEPEVSGEDQSPSVAQRRTHRDPSIDTVRLRLKC